MKLAILCVAGICFANPSYSDSVQDMVRREAVRQGVPVNLALSIAKHESNFKCSAVGKQGERGVMQIKPSTARGIGYRGAASGLNKCQTGIHYGILYLKMAYKQAKGNAYRAAILYNAGLGTKRKRSAYAEKIVKTKLNYGSNQRHKGGKR